jgi:hypothetical protein
MNTRSPNFILSTRIQPPRRGVLHALFAATFAATAFAGKQIDPGDLPLYAANDKVPATAPGLFTQVAPGPAPTATVPPPPQTPSVSVTVNLIRQLVELGVLPKEKADGLLKQAEDEAAQVRAQYAAAQEAAVQTAVVQTLASVRANPELAPSPDASQYPPFTPDPNASRITFIPEVVKSQLRDEIKRDIADDARSGALPLGKPVPEWVSRFRFTADVKVRAEGVNFGSGNDNTGSFPNFNAINTGAPFDTSGTVFSPQLDVDQNRQRMRLQARFGIEADLTEGFSSGIRFATGNTNSPTSPNQDVGAAANGQGGDFSKYAIWLDRAFIRYTLNKQDKGSLSVSLGRFDNPFFSTEAIFANDLGFDGIAVQGRYEIRKGLTPFLTGGFFPVFNTDLNFASNQPAKFKSNDKWLAAVQLGTDWKLHEKVNLKVAGAYYDYINIAGKLSTPFVPLTTSDAGDTDASRPSFAQNGNTYRPLRNILATAANNYGTIDQFQYYGLATPFRDVVASAKLDLNMWEPVQVSVYGEYIRNVAFNRNLINSVAVNNRGTINNGGTGAFVGGDTAWILGVKFGKPAMDKRGDWNIGVNYRYLQSDSLVDGFNDNNFGLGGTNTKGFSLWANYALSSRVNVGVRWTSADQIAGPPLAVDIFQFDFNAKF